MRLRSEFRPLVLAACLLGLVSGLRAETDLEKANRLVKTRHYPEAQALLDRAVQANPKDPEALASMGELQLATKNPKKAVEYADKAIQLNPAKARYYVLRGNGLGIQAQQANFIKAMTMVGDIRGAFEKAVQLEPANRSACFALFGYYTNAPSVAGGGLDKAKTFADQTQVHDAALGHYLKGVLLQRQKNNGAAWAEYRLSQAADARFAPACNALGYAELEQKHVDQALEQFKKQADLEPDNPNSYDSLGDGWMAKGHLDEAITTYRKALSLNPVFVSSMRSLGKALEQAGRRDEAIQHYRTCAQVGAQNGMPQAVTESKTRLKALGVQD